MYVQSEHTKQVAERLAQSKPKKEATEVFNWALRDQKYLLKHTGQHNLLPFNSNNSGSFVLNRLIITFILSIKNTTKYDV